MTGRHAKELSLVDEIGNFHRAIEIAANMSGLTEKPEILYTREKEGFFQNILPPQFFRNIIHEVLLQTGMLSTSGLQSLSSL